MRQTLFSSALRLGILIGGGAVGSAIAATLYAGPSLAAVLNAWNFDADSQRLSVTLPQGITPRYLVFAEPARIVLEIPNTQAGQVQAQSAYDGQVRHIQVSQYEANTVRIVMVLAPGTHLDPRHAQLSSAPISGQVRWTLTPLLVEGNEIARSPANPEPASLPPVPSPATTATARLSSQASSQPEDPSTSAASLVLPTVENDLTALPVDPFANDIRSSERISVPDLDDTVAAVPIAPASSPPAVQSPIGSAPAAPHSQAAAAPPSVASAPSAPAMASSTARTSTAQTTAIETSPPGERRSSPASAPLPSVAPTAPATPPRVAPAAAMAEPNPEPSAPEAIATAPPRLTAPTPNTIRPAPPTRAAIASPPPRTAAAVSSPGEAPLAVPT
ncbi:hypothetical protein C7271_25140, partial [filamentous cyanobacterium CCP5]